MRTRVEKTETCHPLSSPYSRGKILFRAGCLLLDPLNRCAHLSHIKHAHALFRARSFGPKIVSLFTLSCRCLKNSYNTKTSVDYFLCASAMHYWMHHHESLFAACVCSECESCRSNNSSRARVAQKRSRCCASWGYKIYTHADVRDETLVLLRRRAQYRFRCCMSRRIALF